MGCKVTLDKISKEINVSRTTIYKVLNSKGTVSEETTRKVLVALQKYHYVPNYNARELAKRKKYRIAYIGTRHLSAKYFSSSVNEGLRRAYNDFVDNGLEILVEESDFADPKKQLEDIDKMRDLGIENFIIAPSDEYLMKDKVQQLRREGCNIIFLSRCIDHSACAYVGVDYYKSGTLAGEMLTKIMPMGGKIAVVTNSTIAEDSTVRGRYQGFMDWIVRYPAFQVVETIERVNTDEQAQDAVDYLLHRYENLGELDAVYDITYKLNVFAQRLVEMNMAQKIKLVGFDTYPENIPYIRSSVIDIVVGQQLLTQAYDAAKMLFQKLCYGVDYEEKNYYSKLEVIVSSNVDCFI